MFLLLPRTISISNYQSLTSPIINDTGDTTGIPNIDAILHICNIFSSSIGIWINLLALVAALIFLRKLSDAGQRYAGWIGILFSNLFFLVTLLVENISALWVAGENNQSKFLISTFPALFLIFNIILTMLDLFTFINFTYWYKNYCTHFGILVLQVASFGLFCIVNRDCYLWKSLFVAFKNWISLLSLAFLFSMVLIIYVTLFIHCNWVLERLQIKLANDSGNSRNNPVSSEINLKDGTVENVPCVIDIFTMNPVKFSLVEIEAARGVTFNGKAFFLILIIVLVSLTSCHLTTINIRDQSSGDINIKAAFKSCYYLCMLFISFYTAFFSPISLLVHCHHLKLVVNHIFEASKKTRAAPMVQSV